jgi:cysteine-rich repeat protein
MKWLWALPLLVACGNIDVRCGDVVVDEEEACDDGNSIDGDGCSADCTRIEQCGNGAVDGDEQCDDGNLQNGDTCNADCTNSSCGDGAAQPGELCFGAPEILLAGVSAFQVSAGDFDNDGDPDLVVADLAASQLMVLRNDAGVFVNIQSIANGVDTPLSVLLVDLNGDGLEELVSAKFGFGSNNSVIEVFAFDGVSFLLQSSVFRGGVQAQSLVAGQFNDDTQLDLATANVGNSSITTFRNDGNNQFSVLRTQGGLQQPQAIAAGDFNGDGFDDLAVADLTVTTSQTFLSDNNGQLTLQNIFLSGFGGLGAAAGDINGDGLDDYLISQGLFGTSLIYQGIVGALPNKVGAVFGQSSRSPMLADLDGDADLDLVTANGGDVFQNQGLFGSEVTNLLSVFQNEGGVFHAVDTLEVGSGPAAVVAGDFNSDGLSDLVSADVVGAQLTFIPGTR